MTEVAAVVDTRPTTVTTTIVTRICCTRQKRTSVRLHHRNRVAVDIIIRITTTETIGTGSIRNGTRHHRRRPPSQTVGVKNPVKVVISVVPMEIGNVFVYERLVIMFLLWSAIIFFLFCIYVLLLLAELFTCHGLL